MTDIALEAQDLVKIYKHGFKQKITALDHLNLVVRKGEIYGLLGPNGSGKTSAMKAFLGLMRLDSGKITLFGSSPESMNNKKRMGFLPEESYFYKFLTGEESLLFFGRLAGLKSNEIQRKTKDVLNEVDLYHAKDRWVGDYSKGMLRRLGFAFILLKDPDIVFLDEPTVGLDPIGTLKARNLMQHLKERGKTIVLSSHLLGEIENVCDRVAIIYKGRVIKEDALSNILEVPDQWQIILKKDSINSDQIHKVLTEAGAKIESIGRPQKTLEKAFIEAIHLSS